MLDNLLLKLGFRGHDGKAKPGNLDENGNLKVKVSGNNLDENDNIKVADSNVSQQIVGLNQSIASLQTQISNLANIIGQTKGHDGSTWRNLKVDSQGRPVLASDVTVNAEGLVVDVGELDITDRPERELGKVQLSGTDTELVLARDITITQGSTVYILTSEIPGVQVLNTAKKARLYYYGIGLQNVSLVHYSRLKAGSEFTAKTILVAGFQGGYDTRIADVTLAPMLLTKGIKNHTRFAFTNNGDRDITNFHAVLALSV